MTVTAILRKVGLGVLIAADLALITMLFIQHQHIWAWFFIAVTIAVIAFEIGSVIKYKKTISTRYKYFIQEKPFWGYLGLGLFALAIAGLILHLAVW